MSWLAGWTYAKEISLTGQAGAGALFQVDLDIGASAGGDFHLEGGCRNFPQDIEVTDNDGTTLLNFWIEDITADPLTMWVEVADDIGSNQKIWVYYGKSGASTNSNIGTTFLFGDDFPGSSVDSTKWNTNGTPTVSGGNVTVNALDERIAGKTAAATDTIITGYGSLALANYSMFGLLQAPATDPEGDPFIFFQSGYPTASSYNARTYNGSAASVVNLGNTYTGNHKWSITKVGTSSVKYYIDDSLKATITTNVPTGVMYPTLAKGDSGSAGSLIFNYIYERKYNSPEPAFSSAGAEQSAPCGLLRNPPMTGGMV